MALGGGTRRAFTRHVLPPGMRPHRVGDRIVEAAIEGLELGDRDLETALPGELRDRLAKIAVMVDHVVHAVAVGEQLLPVQSRRRAHQRRLGVAASRSSRDALALGARGTRLLDAQGFDELVEEPGNPVLLHRGRRGLRGAQQHLGLASPDELFTVIGKEYVEHAEMMRPGPASVCALGDITGSPPVAHRSPIGREKPRLA